METVVINIRTDPQVKERAQEIAADLGFSLSSLINAYLKQLARTKSISFSLEGEEPSPYLIKALAESENDRRAGRCYSFSSLEEAVDFLDEIAKSKDGN
jgi:addiction module RelB/DinJ family antitoxin